MSRADRIVRRSYHGDEGHMAKLLEVPEMIEEDEDKVCLVGGWVCMVGGGCVCGTLTYCCHASGSVSSSPGSSYSTGRGYEVTRRRRVRETAGKSERGTREERGGVRMNG